MDIVIRATVVFFVIFFITRVVGRRELSSLEPFDIILLVVIGDLIQQGVTQSDYSVTGALLSVGTFGLLTLLLSYLSFRSARLRLVFEGKPLILVEDGKPIERNLRRERLLLDEVAAEARRQQIAALDDVRFAVLETSGQISFIPKKS